ncbi:cytidylate kinase [Keratinibaculum paraultunense]|uniref:Cytidylate kinase n=1 Tax=Keratinibaculum paraultunense TaxID=1278232 RepID=A0A4R3KZW6_9FIRM|nr:(d)CMP kinase [Keratinibaculum paraultunense]QQY80654.1 (d)CMP kinase [Keratinibaculum paraultunense]TCS91389.1 cytidylate kinase [Keratinibaculum paraultunense]
MKKRLVIAIDGPAGAGKSTISKEIAKKLDIEYIDTGAMYRALTLKVLEKGVNIDDIDKILDILESSSIYFKNNHIYLDGINVDKEIRENRISKYVSDIAKIKEVRSEMVKLQRQLSKESNVIVDGRDIGTVVLPHANFKFFITASPEVRADRRYKELLLKGEKVTYEQVLKEIKTRDKIDSTREVAPLKKAKDAYEIDTTNMTIQEVVNKIINIIEGR